MKKLIFGIFSAAVLVSCGGDKSSSDQVANINIGAEGKTLDPQLITSSTSIEIQSMLSEGLSRLDKELKPVPGLSKNWEVSKDGLTWTFHLRDNLKWSNGTPITAHDFKFAWLRALDPKTASEYAYMLFQIKGAEEYNSGKGSADNVGIKVVDDKTLEVHLVARTPYFDSLVGFVTYLPCNEAFFNKHKDNYALEPDAFISSGPFILKNWVHNGSMTLVKNPNYYDAKDVKLQQVNLKFITDSGAALNAFKNDEIDYTFLTGEQYDEFKGDKRVKVLPQQVTWYIQYNTTEKALSSPKVREALLLAINKEEICEHIFKGTSKPAYSLTPEGVGMQGINGDFVTEMGPKIPHYNPEMAKKLLAEGLKEEGLTSLPTISLICNESGSNKKIAEAIQAQLKANLGVNVNIELMAFKERLARMQSKNFDMVLAGWGADYSDPMTFLDLFTSTGGNNATGYANPEYDALVAAAKKEGDKVKRVEEMRQIEGLIARDYPIGPLFFSTHIILINPKFKGAIYNPTVGAEVLIRNAYIDNSAK